MKRARRPPGKAVLCDGPARSSSQARPGFLYAAELHDEAVRMVKKAIERKADRGRYYRLCRALSPRKLPGSSGRFGNCPKRAVED